MPELLVTRALPNPPGRDRRPPAAPTQDQLNNEWAEFSNPGSAPVKLEGYALSHYTFDAACGRTGEDVLMTFTGVVAAGSSVRVHTGSGTPWTEGTVRHLYAGRGNFAWNNACGDTGVLRKSGSVVDYASYDPNPANGAVLYRIPNTNKLAAASASRTA